MDILLNGTVWGILLILFGISLVLKMIFKVEIPLFRIIIGTFFIYLGLNIIGVGVSKKWVDKPILFHSASVSGTNISPNSSYNIIFGQGNIDLSDMPISNKNVQVEINTIFAGSKLDINTNMPIKIMSSSAFAGVLLPNDSNMSFGTTTYETASYLKNSPHLMIKVNTVFGGIKIRAK